MNKLSKADKMQIKLMSELEESKYTYKQVKKIWNNYEIDPTKKQKKSDKILDKLFDLACQKHPAEMGMVGYEFKNEEEMITAINKKNLTIEGIPKKNIKQTGGMNYYKLFNKIITEPCNGPHCTIPVKPEVSNMINNNLKSANPPTEALTQYPGTDRIGNNSIEMPGVSNYIGTPLNNGSFNIKCTGQKGGVLISEPCSGPHCAIPVEPTTSNMINNNLKSANPPLDAFTQYPGTNRLGNNTDSMPGISDYVGTPLNHGPFNIKCTGQKAGATGDTKPTFDSVYNSNKHKDKTFNIDLDKADKVLSINSPYKTTFQEDFDNLVLLTEYIIEGLEYTPAPLGIDNSNGFKFEALVNDFIDNWDEFDPNYHNLIPKLEYYLDLLIEEKILLEFEPFMPNGGGFNDLFSGDTQGTFFSQQKPFKTIGGGFTGISSGDNQGTFYSNITCPKSGINYNISSKMGINILKNYILTLKGGSPWVTDQSSRAFEIMGKVLKEILHKCNNDNAKKTLYQDIKSISESTDLDEQLYEYCIDKFNDELVDYNLRFNGDIRMVIQDDNNFEIFEKIEKNLESLTGGSLNLTNLKQSGGTQADKTKKSTNTILNERSDTDLYIKNPWNIYINPNTFEWVAYNLGKNKNLVWGFADDFDYPIIQYGCDYEIQDQAFFILDLIKILTKRNIYLAGTFTRTNIGMADIRRMIMSIIAPQLEKNNLYEETWFTANKDILKIDHYENVFYIFNQIISNTISEIEQLAADSKNNFMGDRADEIWHRMILDWKNDLNRELDDFNSNTESEYADWLKIRKKFEKLIIEYPLIRNRVKSMLSSYIDIEIDSIMQNKIDVPSEMKKGIENFYFKEQGDIYINARSQKFVDEIHNLITHSIFTQSKGELPKCKQFIDCVDQNVEVDDVCTLYGNTIDDEEILFDTMKFINTKEEERRPAKQNKILDSLL
tara:strand:- start:45 stop:2879 length:2835 start_codon:yes stop_codon:yes gene_type:complete